MNTFKKKLKEWMYSISTEDHYAEYNPDEEQPSFNMGMRSGQGNVNPSSMNLAGNMSSADVSGGNNGANAGPMATSGDDFQIDDFGTGDASQKGVSEVMLAWRHIDAWTEKYNPDLNATLSDPCTQNDITHAEEDLEVSLPPSVKASLRIHDGQEDLESMTGTSGLIYGYQLMTLDQIVAMTQTWRNVAKNLEKHRAAAANGLSNQSSSGSSSAQQQQQGNDNIQQNQFKLPYIPTQSSVPPETVQAAYAHPAWIPLVTDNAGNHIGVDLAPGPKGTYGQVIMFGREFDVKFAIADNWGEFLLAFANDLEIGNWFLIDDSDDYFAGEGELVFRDKKTNGRVQEYMDVLKKRTTQKYNASIAAQQQPENEVPPQQTAQQTQVNADVTATSQPIDDGNDTDFDIDDESIAAADAAPAAEQPAIVETNKEPIATSQAKEETKPEVVEQPEAEEKPVEETPAEEKPVEEAPVEEKPAEEKPIEETPVEEAPVEEAPVEETPVEEAPVEEAPVEEAPIEEESVKETQAEEKPVEETEAEVAEPELSSEKVNEEVKELQTEFENVAL